ncbi:MAG: hypothetical protein QOC81_3358 [Thermoanaerobaculia bacterium]|nr:hypothetical protein [Thermoanaerobaculia bacterium]
MALTKCEQENRRPSAFAWVEAESWLVFEARQESADVAYLFRSDGARDCCFPKIRQRGERLIHHSRGLERREKFAAKLLNFGQFGSNGDKGLDEIKRNVRGDVRQPKTSGLHPGGAQSSDRGLEVTFDKRNARKSPADAGYFCLHAFTLEYAQSVVESGFGSSGITEIELAVRHSGGKPSAKQLVAFMLCPRQKGTVVIPRAGEVLPPVPNGRAKHSRVNKSHTIADLLKDCCGLISALLCIFWACRSREDDSPVIENDCQIPGVCVGPVVFSLCLIERIKRARKAPEVAKSVCSLFPGMTRELMHLDGKIVLRFVEARRNRERSICKVQRMQRIALTRVIRSRAKDQHGACRTEPSFP